MRSTKQFFYASVTLITTGALVLGATGFASGAETIPAKPAHAEVAESIGRVLNWTFDTNYSSHMSRDGYAVSAMHIGTTEQRDPQSPQCSITENAPDRSSELIGTQREVALNRVKQDASLKKIEISSTVEQLNFDAAVALKMEKQGRLFTTVAIPVEGYSPISNFTVVYEENSAISNYAETLYFEGENGNLWMEQWVDGKFIRSKDLGVKFIDNDAMKLEMQNLKAKADEAAASLSQERSIGKIAACLAAATGVGGVAAWAIAAACAGACAFPEPTASKVVCAACIGGYATLGAGGMAAVVGCFQL